jgi:hypothetical protein
VPHTAPLQFGMQVGEHKPRESQVRFDGQLPQLP